MRPCLLRSAPLSSALCAPAFCALRLCPPRYAPLSSALCAPCLSRYAPLSSALCAPCLSRSAPRIFRALRPVSESCPSSAPTCRRPSAFLVFAFYFLFSGFFPLFFCLLSCSAYCNSHFPSPAGRLVFKVALYHGELCNTNSVSTTIDSSSPTIIGCNGRDVFGSLFWPLRQLVAVRTNRCIAIARVALYSAIVGGLVPRWGTKSLTNKLGKVIRLPICATPSLSQVQRLAGPPPPHVTPTPALSDPHSRP